MADVAPNFINPAYASPAQIAQLRAYARLLQEKAISGEAKTPLGAIAAGLMGFQGGREMGKANEQEQASKKAFAEQLMGALKEFERGGAKEPSALLAASANPNMDPFQALLIARMIEKGPPISKAAEGVSITQPSAPIAAPTGSMAQPRPVPTTSVAPQGNVRNLTEGGRDIIPANGAFNKYPGVDPDIAGMLPTADVMEQRKQAQAAILGRQQQAEQARSGYINSGEAAKPKLANIRQLYEMSKNMDEPGARGRLQQFAKDVTGLDVGPNADQYAIFDSILKSLAPEAVQELASGRFGGGRISPAVLQQYIAKGPQFWQNKPVRNAILNSMASPLHLAIRQGHKALQIPDPVQAQSSVYGLEIDNNPLDKPSLGTTHSTVSDGKTINYSYWGVDPNSKDAWEQNQ